MKTPTQLLEEIQRFLEFNLNSGDLISRKDMSKIRDEIKEILKR